MLNELLTRTQERFRAGLRQVGRSALDQHESIKKELRKASDVWGTGKTNKEEKCDKSRIEFDYKTLYLKKDEKSIKDLSSLEIRLCQFIFQEETGNKFKTSEVENTIYSKTKSDQYGKDNLKQVVFRLNKKIKTVFSCKKYIKYSKDYISRRSE